MEEPEEPRKAEPEPPATEQEDKADAKVPPATEDKPADSKSDKKRAMGKEPGDKKEREQKSEEQGLSRSKRSRKSADAFAPEDFKHVDRSIDVASGRGQRLGDLEAVCESVNSYASTSEDMLLAHKLLFTTRGKPPRKEMKANILNFSGYLKKKKEGQDEKEIDKEDEEAEAKMSTKAYKLTVPGLKRMCDFFAIDRKGQNDKEAIVDCLLDFLGAPSENKLKGSRSSKNKASQEKDFEVIEFGTMPSDEQLRQWVRAYVRCFNLEKVTIKHALEVAAEKFGVDLASKKDTLKELLTEEM